MAEFHLAVLGSWYDTTCYYIYTTIVYYNKANCLLRLHLTTWFCFWEDFG